MNHLCVPCAPDVLRHIMQLLYTVTASSKESFWTLQRVTQMWQYLTSEGTSIMCNIYSRMVTCMSNWNCSLAMPSLTCLMEALLWHCWNWTSHSTKNWCPWLLGRRRGDCPHCRMSWGEKPLLSYFQSYKIKGWLSSLGQRKGFSSLHHQDPKLIWRC